METMAQLQFMLLQSSALEDMELVVAWAQHLPNYSTMMDMMMMRATTKAVVTTKLEEEVAA